ncbi:MAG: hypothetical protein LUE87_05425, partial [Lachnospiraceae bacterium]|nr:hypothetical protein [Lachnospiraceae bacterium]
GHAFFAASSIRNTRDTYYFIYSSQWQHELCYATSKYPDRDFVYGGVLVSNGDIGFQGRRREDRLAGTGNNHGSIVNVNGQWYVFYHRQTHKTTYSRQGCAEKLTLEPDGKFLQAEMTSCGLNDGPLAARGSYPAPICCNLTNGHMPHVSTEPIPQSIPYITHQGNDRYITDISDGTMIGYKYFVFDGEKTLTLRLRGKAQGTILVSADDHALGEISVEPTEEWTDCSLKISEGGVHALYLRFQGEGSLDLMEFCFE